MSRILFATLGSLGDLHPPLALALKMRGRGHSIAVCASPYYRAKIESLGFEFHPLRPDIAPDAPELLRWTREIMNPRNGADRLLRGFLFPRLKETWDDLSRAVASQQSELLVSGEIVYAAPLVAQKTGVRWASLTLSPMSFFSAYELPILPPVQRVSACLRRFGPGLNRTTIKLIKFCTRSWSKPVRKLRAELDLPIGADPIYEGKHSPQLVLAMFSPLFAQPQPDWPARTEIVGFCFYDGSGSQNSQKLDDFLAAGDPPIVFTLGSAAVHVPGNFYGESARAALRLNRRAILLVGQNTPPEVFSKDIAVFDYLPFSKIFPHAAAIVHQGGIGTTAQALRAGRPMLVMPYGFDQPDNADRLVRMNVARTISRREYTVARTAAALNDLLGNPIYQQSATAISRKLKDEDGAETGANALERLLATVPGPETSRC